MPTYVYRRADGTTFEVTQRISEDALTVDPDTGEPVQRVIGGGAGLIFKGSGFYVTDYVRKSGSESGTESSSDTSTKATDATVDSKPEKKASTAPSTSDSKKASSTD